MDDARGSAVSERTRLTTARARLRGVVEPVERTERLPVSTAVGRTLAADVTAQRPIPEYDRVATDGFAVRASDTVGAADRSPVVLRERDRIGDRGAVAVEAGDGLPDGADAVVPSETSDGDRRDGKDASDRDGRGGELEVFDAVADGANVERIGATVERDETVLARGRRFRPSDPALCRTVGVSRVRVRERPTVGILPVGEGLAGADPGPGEVVETNGLTVATFADRWSGEAVYRDPVTCDRHALRPAIERDLTKDLLVTVGGAAASGSVPVPDVIDDLGEVFARGLAIDPGRSAGIGRVRETPVLLLPGPPVACLVAAVQLLEPAIKRACGLEPATHPTRAAELATELPSEPGVRTFARVTVADPGESGGDGADFEVPSVSRVRTGEPNDPTSVATADGWVVVPEEREAIATGERVSVDDWEYPP